MGMNPEEIDVNELLAEAAAATAGELSAIATVVDDSAEIKDPDEPHIKIEAQALVFRLKLFATMNKSLQDVLARACLFELDGNALKSTMSDGIFCGSVTVPVISRKDPFPTSFTLDYESLMKVAQLAGRYVYLVCVDKTFYVDFFGGRVHIPSYELKPELIKGRVAIADPSTLQLKDVSAVDFLQFLKISENFLASNQLPALAFAFMTPDGVFLSNGYTVMKGNYKFPFPCSIRISDLPFLEAICAISMAEGIKVAQDKDRFIFVGPQVSVILPAVNEQFPPSYLHHFAAFTAQNGSYMVDFTKLILLLSMLSKVYRSSGVVTLKSEGKTLTMSSKSQDEKMSFMTLSRVAAGEPQDVALAFSVPGLLNVMRSLKTFKHLNLAFAGQTFCLSNERVNLVVFGTGTDAKSQVFKARKEAARSGK